MNWFDVMKSLLTSLQHLMCLRTRLGDYSFTIGAMIIGLFVVSCSLALLQFLLNRD